MQGSVVFGERSPRDRERGRGREREQLSLRIMERQLASGFCSAIEAITLHYAEAGREAGQEAGK